MFCRCGDCQNPFGKNGTYRIFSQTVIVIQIINLSVRAPKYVSVCYCCILANHSFPTAEGIMTEDSKRYLYTGADLDHSEGEHEFVVERSPHLQSPMSKESSFLQTPPHLRASSRDTHVFPQAVLQWQAPPRSWHCSNKRNNNDRAMDDSANYKNSHNDWQLPKPEDSYSISKCVKILNGMVELSQVEKSVAPDVFLLPGNREIFISLGGDVRALWLKRKIQHLT